MGNKPVRVRCNETGEIFESITAAAKALNLSAGNISSHLAGFVLDVKGYTFTRERVFPRRMHTNNPNQPPIEFD